MEPIGLASTKMVTCINDLLPLCYLIVSFTGTALKKTDNVSIVKIADGIFDVFCTGFSNSTVFLVTMNQWAGGYYYDPLAEYTGSGYYRVTFMQSQGNPPNNNAGFSFIAY